MDLVFCDYSADGKYEMTPDTKATIYSNGIVRWQPPASFKSSCSIDVTYFPFDEQECEMKFGSWTYNQMEVCRHCILRLVRAIAFGGEYIIMPKEHRIQLKLWHNETLNTFHNNGIYIRMRNLLANMINNCFYDWQFTVTLNITIFVSFL